MTFAELKQAFRCGTKDYQAEESEAFSRLLEADLRSLERLRALEQDWLAELRAGRLAFNFDFDRSITRRYRRWVSGARLRLRQLKLQEKKGGHPAPAEEFRRRVDEARAILGERLRDEQSARDRSDLIAENGDR